MIVRGMLALRSPVNFLLLYFFFFQLHFDGCLPVNLEKKWDWSNLVKSGDTNIAFPKPVGLLLPLIFLFVLFLRYA